jgi:hypothetical protein
MAILPKHIQRQRLVGFLERFLKTLLYLFVFFEDSFLQSEVIPSLSLREYNATGAVRAGIHVAHGTYAAGQSFFRLCITKVPPSSLVATLSPERFHYVRC